MTPKTQDALFSHLIIPVLTLARSLINSSNVPSPTTSALLEARADDRGVLDVALLAPPADLVPLRGMVVVPPEEEEEEARGVDRTRELRRSSADIVDAAAWSDSGCSSWPAVSGWTDSSWGIL